MKRIKTLLIGICCFLPSAFLLAQTVPADLAALFDQTLANMRTSMGAKSLSAAIQFPDGAVWANAAGISSQVPIDYVNAEDAYLIGSVTKTITSACILQLDEEGLLSIDDSLHKWIDTFPFINPNITIKQLLQHTSGIHDVLATEGQQDSLLADMSRFWTVEELIAAFIRPPDFQPGTSWKYSNTNYFLLGMIIEKATGNPFYVELRNRFFNPLGLGSFAIPAFEPLNSPVAHVWLNLTADNILDDGHSFYMSWLSLNSTAGAAGGYFSTPTDCTKWMRSYMRGDLLSAETMEKAKTLVNAPGVEGGKYGLGLMRGSFAGEFGYGHGGDLAYSASSYYFPEKDISITVFTNDANHNSWALSPVVSALMQTCKDYEAVSATSEENSKQPSIQAFPNPIFGVLRVEIAYAGANDGIEVQLLDIHGRTVATSSSQQGEAILNNLSHLPAGVYLAVASKDGRTIGTTKVYK
ncbi:MAG: serine hydrolase [Saprospiraceae bacterium]|nr:serine hydrolase [Saprospiraceae bacterium]